MSKKPSIMIIGAGHAAEVVRTNLLLHNIPSEIIAVEAAPKTLAVSEMDTFSFTRPMPTPIKPIPLIDARQNPVNPKTGKQLRRERRAAERRAKK